MFPSKPCTPTWAGYPNGIMCLNSTCVMARNTETTLGFKKQWSDLSRFDRILDFTTEHDIHHEETNIFHSVVAPYAGEDSEDERNAVVQEAIDDVSSGAAWLQLLLCRFQTKKIPLCASADHMVRILHAKHNLEEQLSSKDIVPQLYIMVLKKLVYLFELASTRVKIQILDPSTQSSPCSWCQALVEASSVGKAMNRIRAHVKEPVGASACGSTVKLQGYNIYIYI